LQVEILFKLKLHEHQAKEILRTHQVPVPNGMACFSVEEAVSAADTLGGSHWVVKAQIHAGGRGKGGGVEVVSSIEGVRLSASKILGMTLVTHQTGPSGKVVERLLIEDGLEIANELYIGLVVDRGRQMIALMASSEGGMNIEDVAINNPEKICTLYIDSIEGINQEEARSVAAQIGLPEAVHDEAVKLFSNLYQVFITCDATLLEVNPLVVTSDGNIVAVDAKIDLDDSAMYRHPEFRELRDLSEEDPNEIEASRVGLNYISLEGNIGCLVNGAGLAMATMDIIKLHDGDPANFLDVGGGATAEQVSAAFRIMLKHSNVRAILVNIFGGIMRCDVIARGIVEAAQQVDIRVPLVVRLEGTNVQEGRKILSDSDLSYLDATTMEDAAQKVVEAVRK
jgi:succinyl-CoA synthetase beta subunit